MLARKDGIVRAVELQAQRREFAGHNPAFAANADRNVKVRTVDAQDEWMFNTVLNAPKHRAERPAQFDVEHRVIVKQRGCIRNAEAKQPNQL
jgi:hypothetical protein